MSGAEPIAPTSSRWLASPQRLAALILGLWLFGAGEALIIHADLGNSPWTVLAEGAAERTGTSIGLMTVLLSFVVLLIWIPLRQRPGLGTVANALLVGGALGVTLSMLPDTDGLVPRLALVFGGIALIAVGSAFYLGVRLGPGPRDGLMTGLHRVTGKSVRLMRFAVEGTALLAGVVLGGTAGIGTVLFAVLIGPAVQLTLGIARAPASEL